MKVIITQTIEEFEILQSKIHNSLSLNIENYNAERWADANLKNVTTNEIACPIETEGVRGQIIFNNCLSQEEIDSIVDLSQDDENWFPKMDKMI